MARKPRDKAPPRRQQAALPWRMGAGGVEVMLITSRDTGRWVVPKGWPMRKKTPQQAAAQEAWEEAGIRGDVADKPLGRFHYPKVLKNGRTQVCSVELYPMTVAKELDAWPEATQRERVWMDARTAAAAVDEPELRALIEAFDALKSVA